MTINVQQFRSTDTGAPTCTGQVGSLVTLLNKCLVDGYSTAAVTSITESGTTYTVTLTVSNTTLVTNDYITIAGGSPAGINGTWRITVSSGTVVTFVGPGSLGTITGTITYAKSALGWARPFSAGTNSQTYRAATGSRMYLQLVDNGGTTGGAREAFVYGAEVMSADQTVTSGQFPTSAQITTGLCWRKSSTADATARAWTLIGDGKSFYLQMNTNATNVTTWLVGFGDFPSLKSGDAYNCFISGGTSFNSATAALPFGATNAPNVFTGVAGLYIPRTQAQTGTSLNASITGFGQASSGNGASITYPNAADSGAYFMPHMIGETTGSSWRGRLPGCYNPFHSLAFTNYDTISGVVGLSGVTLVVLNGQSGGAQSQVGIDVTGPWT